MNWNDFKVTVPGKWVLTGEHSVLRGGTAIALPHPEYHLTLIFSPDKNSKGLHLKPNEAEKIVHEILESVKEEWEADDRKFIMPKGLLTIESSIPIGAGLGSSAALCVALTRWMQKPLNIEEKEVFTFATQLEHRFHGKSSGMDIAVILSDEPISYIRGRGPKALGIKKLPRFTFHDTTKRCRTNECIYRVEKIMEDDAALGRDIDEKMNQASRKIMEGLVRFDTDGTGIEQIREGMKMGQECFYEWRLVPGEAKRLEESLYNQGALAVKITGAGGGGMLAALWG
jgi:mevalonate kinase